LITAGEHGIVVPVGSIADITEGNATLRVDAPLRQALGAVARRKIQNKFSSRQVVTLNKSLIDDIL